MARIWILRTWQEEIKQNVQYNEKIFHFSIHNFLGERQVTLQLEQKYKELGSSLVAQWLGFQAFTTMAWVQPLVRELRSCKLYSTAKKKEKVENYISSSDFRNMILFIQCSMRSKQEASRNEFTTFLMMIIYNYLEDRIKTSKGNKLSLSMKFKITEKCLSFKLTYKYYI